MKIPPRRGTATLAAVLVALLSVVWLARTDRDADPVGWALTLLVVATGIGVAVGLSRQRRWSLTAYLAWAAFSLVRHVYVDARVEPVWWKVAIGGLVMAAILAAIGVALRRASASDGTVSS